jgi:2-keto-4-pentenoate hydratase/2-oxohepta-3-ene-1,7-dioic acid hydratase in catechol pathway
MTLLPGDVVSLGTPTPTAQVHPGDAVELEIAGIGVLHNSVVAIDDAQVAVGHCST